MSTPLETLHAIFQTMPHDSLRQLLNAARMARYPAGTTLCHDGATEDVMYILLRGSADVFVYQGGQRFYISQLTSGEWFGEMGLILRQPRIGDVVTAEDAVVLEIDTAILDQITQTAPEVVISIMRLLVMRLMKQQERLLTELAGYRRRDQPEPVCFISYSRHDSSFARRLHDDLLKHGVPTWIDVFALEAGVAWSRDIQKALNQCPLMLVILSPTAVASENVEDEWNYFLDNRKPVVPILYAPCSVPFRLNKLQYVDFVRMDYASAMAHLLTVINRIQAANA